MTKLFFKNHIGSYFGFLSLKLSQTQFYKMSILFFLRKTKCPYLLLLLLVRDIVLIYYLLIFLFWIKKLYLFIQSVK